MRFSMRFEKDHQLRNPSGEIIRSAMGKARRAMATTGQPPVAMAPILPRRRPRAVERNK